MFTNGVVASMKIYRGGGSDSVCVATRAESNSEVATGVGAGSGPVRDRCRAGDTRCVDGDVVGSIGTPHEGSKL